MVAPLVGAWIEIAVKLVFNRLENVAPLVGAWIEIVVCFYSVINAVSLPSWERGLKLGCHAR